MTDVKSVICDHLDLSFLRGLKIGSLNFVGLWNVRSSVFTKDEIKQMINNDVLIYAISHNILSVDKRNITKKIKDIQSRFTYILKSIKSDDIKKYIAKKHKSYNETQANELYQKILDFLSQDTSYITIMSYVVFNRLKDIVNNARKIVDDTKLDLHLVSSDGNKRDVITVSISDRIRDYFKNKLISFLKEREKNPKYVSYLTYYFLSELINSDLRTLNDLKDYANMLNTLLLLINEKSDCSLNNKAIELVEERSYKNVNYSVALIGPIHLSILDYLDRVNLSTEEILDVSHHVLSTQISSELERLKSYSKKESYAKQDKKDNTKDLYKTAKTRINFAGTEIGKFAKEIFDEFTNHPIARAFKYLFKLSASIGKAIDVRFGTGRGADLISRIESFVNDWELNLGDTEYSDLIKARKAAMKKKPAETEYSSKSESVVTTESVKQSKISSILSGNKSEVKDQSMQSSRIKTTENKVEQEIDKKEIGKGEKSETKSKPVGDQNVDLFKKIHEDILVIKNMLISSGAALSGQKNIKTDTQIQNIFQNICQSKKRDDHDKPDEDDDDDKKDDKKDDKEKDKDQDKEDLKDNKKESAKGSETEKSHLRDVYKNILQKGGNMNVPHPSTIESKSESSDVKSGLGTEANKYPSLSEVKPQSDIKLERGLPKDMGKTPTSPTSGGDACKIGEQDKNKQQQQQQQNSGERKNFASMFGGKGQAQVSSNTQTTYNIASSTTINQNQDKEKEKEKEKESQESEEGGGMSVGTILKILISILALLMPVIFGALAITFFVKMIKKLFMPDVEFSGGNIDFQKLSEMSDEQKKKLKGGIEDRYKALASRKFDARSMDQLHEYTGFSAGDVKPSELIVQNKDGVKSVPRTAPTREELKPKIEEQRKYDVLEKTESLDQIRDRNKDLNYEQMYARLSAVEQALINSLVSHTRYNETLARMIENTYKESEMIKKKKPEDLEQP